MTATTDRPVRRRGIVRLDENVLCELIRLPEGQRIIGFRPDFARLCIDVCVEGDGLPEVITSGEAPVVSVDPYLTAYSLWAGRGPELAEMVQVLVDEHLPGDNAIIDLLAQTLDGTYDPRAYNPAKEPAP